MGGDVPHPLTVTVPVGTPMREVMHCRAFTGTKDGYALIVGGPCMGKIEEDWDAPVTKTTGGLLPAQTHASVDRAAHAKPGTAAQDRAGGVLPVQPVHPDVPPKRPWSACGAAQGPCARHHHGKRRPAGQRPLGAGLLQLRRMHQLCLPYGPFTLGGHGTAQGRNGARGHPARCRKRTSAWTRSSCKSACRSSG